MVGRDKEPLPDGVVASNENVVIAVEYVAPLPELVLPSGCGGGHFEPVPPAAAAAATAAPRHASNAPAAATATTIIAHPFKVQPDEKHDIGAAMEHLIIQGNYYRHLQWRVKEWKRSNGNEQGEKVAAMAGAKEDAVVENDKNNEESDGTSNDDGDDDLKPRTKKQKRSSAEQDTAVAVLFEDVHAQDTRIYNPEEKYEGHEPDLWPKAPYTAARELRSNDRRWDEELSDNLNPVAFSKMRLTGVVVPVIVLSDTATTTTTTSAMLTEDQIKGGNEDEEQQQLLLPALDYDLDPEQTGCDVAESQAARAMLLHCWERAVHAAATTVTAAATATATAVTTPTPGRHPEPPQRQQQKASAAAARTREGAVDACRRLQINVPQQQQQQQQLLPTTASSANESSASAPKDDVDDDDDDDDDSNTNSSHVVEEHATSSFPCHVCGTALLGGSPPEATRGRADHGFGTRTSSAPQGCCCCWLAVERRRRNLLAGALESEVRVQMQQLVRVVLMDADYSLLIGVGGGVGGNAATGGGGKRVASAAAADPLILDGFDVLRILENRLAASRVVASTFSMKDGGEPVAVVSEESMELQLDEPPLVINAAVLEAARFRLIDRYARVPR